MKTLNTQILMGACLLIGSVAFAQDENRPGNSNYEAQHAADLQNQANNSVEESQGTTTRGTKLLAADLINYQAVARDASGDLMMNETVSVEFIVHEGSSTGTNVFSETQSLITDSNGVFSTEIGDISPLNIEWSGNNYFLEVVMNGSSVGTSRFVSVPYAKSADSMPERATIGTNLDDADVLTISGGDGLGEVIDIRATMPVLPNNDILNLEMPTGSANNAQFIEAVNDGNAVFQVQGDGRVIVNAETTAPEPNTVYGNSMPVAFAKINGSATPIDIDSGYGITSVEREATGTYLITLDNSASGTFDLIPMVTVFGSLGDDIATFTEASPNSFRVHIRNVQTDALANNVFSVVVFGN